MAGMAAHCPDCGTELPSDGAIEGLCPQCLLSLALRDSDLDLEERETLDGPSPARILGGRYQMRELLGRGGRTLTTPPVVCPYSASKPAVLTCVSWMKSVVTPVPREPKVVV